MSFKKTKVVMLPTNEKAPTHDYLFLYKPSNRLVKNGFVQHLYFLSDEEIKEGDWIGFPNLKKFVPVQYFGGDLTGGEKKIIATTDKSLSEQIMYYPNGAIIGGIESYKLLPQPSQSFIEKFVEEYNKGNVITEVLVEYEEIKVLKQTLNEGFGSYYHKAESEFVLKVNPKDNTIAIRKVNLKGEHIINFVNDFIKEFPEQNLEYLKLRAESWIEENL